MNLTIDEKWNVEILVPIEGCLLLVSNSSYLKIKKKIASVESPKSREMLVDLYRKHFRCESNENKICLPHSLVRQLKTEDLGLVKFIYEEENCFFIYNKNEENGKKLWKYLLARSLTPIFIEMKVEIASDETLLRKEQNKFAAFVSETVVKNRGEIYNPVCFYGKSYSVNNCVNDLISKSGCSVKAMNLRQMMGEVYKTYRKNKDIENCSLLTDYFQCFLIENFDEIEDDDNFYFTNKEIVKVLKKFSERKVQVICTASYNLSIDDKLRNRGFDYIQTEVV